MLRLVTRVCAVGAVVGAVLLGALGVLVAWPTQTRVGILATRLVVIAATKAPPAFSTLLTAVLGVGGSGTRRPLLPTPRESSDGPVLVLATSRNPFSHYLAEILRAEGLNLFSVMDVSEVDAPTLAPHDVVVLGETPLDDAQVAMLTEWTHAGGTLIAMRPDRRLAPLLGLTPADGTSSEGYLRVDTSTGPGVGIVDETMQFHGVADHWSVAAATPLATLYRDAVTPSGFPAVTVRRVGTHGGVAAAFAYDLARSVVLTRQGNPAWAGEKRHGLPPRRSVDLFAPDWLDFDKIAIPQADEQQRLLANLIIQSNLHRRPLPRFWYLPKGVNAAIVMTGDDHDDVGLVPRFEAYRAASPADCSLADWECVRATGYAYLGTTLTPADAQRYTDLGFEVALHVNTDCVDWSPPSLAFLVGLQLEQFRTVLPRIPAPSTNRTHCVAWSDWSTQPEVEAAYGIRLDTNYYFYPSSWVQKRVGLFNGSGFPMRFAAADGSTIDCYQAATQLTDESDLALPEAADTLLDRANGPQGYYGVVTANMHFDKAPHPGSDAIVASAKAHGVPVVSARQMLEWLDGRDASSFEGVRFTDATLRFTIAVGVGARNLRAMVPMRSAVGVLARLTHDGSPVTYAARAVKGIDYAFFPAEPGGYAATYE